MKDEIPVNRIESALNNWRAKEERFGKLFSADILESRPFLQEKLKYFDSLKAAYGRTASEEERLALRIVGQERNKIEKQLYPTVLLRIAGRITRTVKQKKAVKDMDRRNATNEQHLKEAVGKAGFDGIRSKLEQKIKVGEREFSILESYYVNEKEKMDFDLFFTRDSNGHYQFEKYKASLQAENKPGENKEQTFFHEPGNAISATQAYNLLAGRAVQKEHISGEKEGQSTWIQLDFNDKDATGNYKMKVFGSAYGYDLKEALQQLPLKELMTAEGTEKLVAALKGGHGPLVTLQRDGNEQPLFIEANPRFKSLNVYDAHLKKISVASVLGNKTLEKSEMAQKSSIELKVAQGRKKGVSL